MTRGAALFLAIGFAAAAFLYGGVWEYGDGFIFNRFNGQVIYVDLPDSEEAVRLAQPSERADDDLRLARSVTSRRGGRVARLAMTIGARVR